MDAAGTDGAAVRVLVVAGARRSPDRPERGLSIAVGPKELLLPHEPPSVRDHGLVANDGSTIAGQMTRVCRTAADGSF